MTLSTLSATVLTDEEEFARLEDRWDRLVDRCPSATPFQVHAWLSSWWRAYGSPGRLRVVLVHSGEDLVAAWALHVRRGPPVRTLSPLGIGVSDFSDVLVADDLPGGRAEALDLLAAALRDLGGWDVVDLPEVRPGAAVVELAGDWPARWSSTPASTCLELPVQDVTTLADGLPRSTAKHVRRKLRRLDEVGIATRVVPAEDVPAAVTDFLRLHAAQWEGRGITAEHMRPRFQQFLAEALPRMVERGQALVAEYRLDGELTGVRVNVVGTSLMGAYLSGVSPALRDHVDVATLMLRHNMQLATERGIPVLSLLRGQEDYKLRWRPDVVVNQRVVLARPGSPSAPLYLSAARGRATALPWLRQHTPWIKDLRDRARRLLAR